MQNWSRTLPKLAGGFLICLLIINIILFALRRISVLLFWIIIGVGFIGMHLLKKQKNT